MSISSDGMKYLYLSPLLHHHSDTLTHKALHDLRLQALVRPRDTLSQ